MNGYIKKFFTPNIIITLVGWATIMIFLFAQMNAHTNDENIHMSYKAKIEKFVPRGEFILLLDELANIRLELQDINKYLRDN